MKEEHWNVTSSLIRHEISFVLGQVYESEDFVGACLKEVSLNEKESSIARHEAILAYYDCDQDKELMYKPVTLTF